MTIEEQRKMILALLEDVRKECYEKGKADMREQAANVAEPYEGIANRIRNLE